ncbi:DUF3817 domain-containing protein [Nonomuraea sp. NPDC059194]|uniref:DUF3817 domain-containing protein n=1 Tax=Nonomuraea sp. NPDC059194 TaxID=3346764 RepID=UPI0036C144FD
MRLLRIAAGVEAVSLVVLLGNLVTVHTKTISTFAGPLHGISYVVVVVAASLVPSAAGWRAFLPGIGGLLALRRARSHARPPACGAQEG